MASWSWDLMVSLSALHSHKHTRPRFERGAHVGDDFVIGELETVMA
jgi:hypothetical protein